MKRFAHIIMIIVSFVPAVVLACFWFKAESSYPKKGRKKLASDDKVTCVFTDS